MAHGFVYEDICLHDYATVTDLLVGPTRYFAFDNDEWPHQGRGNCTPRTVYFSCKGGGASIPDYWERNARGDAPTGQCGSAAT
jgi:putative transposase